MLKRANVLLGLAILLAAVLVFAPRALAQRGGMGGMTPPSMMGLWNPVVGSGATYELVGKDGKKQTISMAIVNKDDSGGYWMEYLVNTNDNQQTVMQMLMVKDGASMQISKMVIQPAGPRSDGNFRSDDANDGKHAVAQRRPLQRPTSLTEQRKSEVNL